MIKRFICWVWGCKPPNLIFKYGDDSWVDLKCIRCGRYIYK